MSNVGNNDIQEFIEYGTGAVKDYLVTVKDKQRVIRWSPISFPLAKVAYYQALLQVDEEYRDYLSTTKEKREKKKMTRPPAEVILTFNFFHSANTIFYAIRNHYHGITLAQVESLPIPNFDEFHREIAIGSGIMDGQQTVGSFPADKPTQNAQS